MRKIDALIATGALSARYKDDPDILEMINEVQKHVENGDAHKAAITFGKILGTITPEEVEDAKEFITALHNALAITHLSSKVPDSMVPIEELDLSVRSCNNLKKAGFNTLADLAKITRDQLDEMRNLTKKNRKEIIQTLVRHGYEIKDD